MLRRPEFTLFVVFALALHVAGVAAFGPVLARAPDDAAARQPSLRAADPALAELIDLWNTPPETGEASDLSGPSEEAPPPDTTEAAKAEAGVEAAAEVEDLGEFTGPGKDAKRPIFAPKPKTKTTAPQRLATVAVETVGIGSLALSADTDEPAVRAPGSLAGPRGDAGEGSGVTGIDGGEDAQSPGATFSALGGGGIGAALALPDRPEEESFAPETAPVPPARPTPEALTAALAAQPKDDDQPSIVIEGAPPPEDEDPEALGAVEPIGGGLPDAGALGGTPPLGGTPSLGGPTGSRALSGPAAGPAGPGALPSLGGGTGGPGTLPSLGGGALPGPTGLPSTDDSEGVAPRPAIQAPSTD
ncbi:MAG: hypothetical protein AAGC57_07355 [Pseudomonadota bacterium]